jgi:hypothetical protein
MRLDPDQLEVLAALIADRLMERPKPEPRIVGVRTLARILDVDPSVVYAHADELGVMRVGRALRFNLDLALERSRARDAAPAPSATPPARKRRRKTATLELLPIKGRDIA